ncbi:MAG TPA: alternative ribosome rescue aminoacyl-tRNA hydrolase ArfB [Rhodothermales bacterium]|nr:alternative ribosome rescue aminoacyl-tRNA hydrolase ArfB [Rhodothermales bacterium]
MRSAVIHIAGGVSIDQSELDFRYVRARGPGGQHVNKASTAVQLRFDVPNSGSLPDRVKRRLLRSAKSYLTGDGVIILFADRHRSQLRNREDAIERLAVLVRAAAAPVRVRRKTKPTVSSVRRRIEQKKKRGGVKRERQWRPGDE